MRPYTPPPPNKEKVKPKDQKLLFLFFLVSHKGLVSGQVAGGGGESTRKPVLQALTSRRHFGKSQLLDFLCDFLKIVTLEAPERARLQNRILLAVQETASQGTGRQGARGRAHAFLTTGLIFSCCS